MNSSKCSRYQILIRDLSLHISRFLYIIILALDANFRLNNRLRSTEAADPGLHTGHAYFVSQPGYNDHLRKYVTQEDVSRLASSARGILLIDFAVL